MTAALALLPSQEQGSTTEIDSLRSALALHSYVQLLLASGDGRRMQLEGELADVSIDERGITLSFAPETPRPGLATVRASFPSIDVVAAYASRETDADPEALLLSPSFVAEFQNSLVRSMANLDAANTALLKVLEGSGD